MSGNGTLIGIDLGTTYSAVASLDQHGNPVVLPNREGEMLTPSAVLILGDGSVVVGQAALDVALEYPNRVAMLVKRQMGYPQFDKPIAGKTFRPETISALILRKLILDAEQRLGKIKRAVITVPAYFDDTRRKATQDAGLIAGLDTIDILDEPTAAALAYYHQPHTPDEGEEHIKERTVLVYDLGGGTFDVTLVRLAPHLFQTIGIEGDVRLGGKDWDQRIVDYVAEEFAAKHGSDPRESPLAVMQLASAAERTKRTLTKIPQTNITCTDAGKVLTVPLTRAKFEELTSDLLLRTKLTTRQLMSKVGKTWAEVDRVLAVGGSTHMPMTVNMLRELSGKEPDRTLAVSEVVAQGAALHAGIVAVREKIRGNDLDDDAMSELGQVVEIHVNAHSLGIEAKSKKGERINSILVPKNTQLPASGSRVFRTSIENQQQVCVKALQGESSQAEACITIGECWIEELAPELPLSSPIQVRCSVGEDGIIDVMALDMTSGQMARAEVHRKSGMSEEAIAKEAEWVRSLDIQ